MRAEVSSNLFNCPVLLDKLDYLVSLSSAFSIFLAIAGPGLEVSALCILSASAEP